MNLGSLGCSECWQGLSTIKGVQVFDRVTCHWQKIIFKNLPSSYDIIPQLFICYPVMEPSIDPQLLIYRFLFH